MAFSSLRFFLYFTIYSSLYQQFQTGYLRQSALELHGNDIFLDFFSGSATSAQSIMRLNADDDGDRRYILVQYPEAYVQDTETYKSGYHNICEIGKERIRRAGEKIKEEIEAANEQLKLGE